jgi:FG-GAP-like repeat/Secretion system C-terminal sorting domain
MMKRLLVLLLICAFPLMAAAEFEWQDHMISAISDYVQGVCAADLDQDGDQDIILSSFEDFSWWENDGYASFTEHQLTSGDLFFARSAIAADLDGDGDMDIIMGGASYPDIAWWENDGYQNFAYHMINELNIEVYDLSGCDIDADGDMDIFRAGSDLNGRAQVSWYENDGSQQFTEHVLLSGGGAVGAEADDIDGDGDIDILAATNPISVWANDGTGNFSEFAIEINPEYSHMYDFDLANFNGDSNVDILGNFRLSDNSGYAVNWMDIGPFSEEHQIAIPGSMISIDACDLDADGDLDVLSLMNQTDRPYCWENVDGNGLTWTENIPEAPYPDIRIVEPADLDGDGDLDVIGYAWDDDILFWWELLGEPTPPDPVVVTLAPSSPTMIVPRGGSFSYDLAIDFNLNNPTLGFIWSEAVLPNNNSYGPIYSTGFLFAPGMTIDVTGILQTIPMMAPLGGYSFVVNAGPNVGVSIASDAFLFTVTAAQIGDGFDFANDWTSLGHERIAAAANGETLSATPGDFALLEAYPNPFNPTTTINVALPIAAELNVVVFNTLGQQVAELANGEYSAGTHSLNLDGTSLASGIYFVQATVPGELNAVQKIVLMK